MFDELKNVAGGLVGGNADPQAVGDAADQHVQNMDPNELGGHLQTAAANAQQSGQPDIAQQLLGIVSKMKSDPSGAKDDAVALIRSNPQILQRFAPGFAQGIMGKLGM